MHGTETGLHEALSEMRNCVVRDELRRLIEKESAGIERQKERFEIIFAFLKEVPAGPPSDVVQYMTRVWSAVQDKYGGSEISDSMMIMLNHALSLYLIHMHQKAIHYSDELGYSAVSRILKRSMQTERELAERLKEFENGIELPGQGLLADTTCQFPN